MKTKNSLVRQLAVLLMLGGSLAATGCSTVTTAESMTPEPLVMELKNNQETVALSISGEARGIAVENFRKALADAILQNGLFAAIADDAQFLLEVKFNAVSQPAFGMSFTVNTDTTWKLYRLADRQLLWSDAILSSYSGGGEGGFVGANRLRRATEGAARENIRNGIEMLGRFEL